MRRSWPTRSAPSSKAAPPPLPDGENRALLRPVAEAVAAGTSFLVSHFAAYALTSADTVVADPFDPRWRASLPRHAGQAMRDDLNQRLGPDLQRATDLLRPLAYAEGQGLLWEDIWRAGATTLLEHLNHHAQTEWTQGWATGNDFTRATRRAAHID